MVNKLRLEQFVFTAIVIFIMTGISLTAHGSSNSSAIRALAGQMCPNGSYVIGFDSEGKIICADACGNGVPNKDGDEEELAVETSAPDPGSLPPIPNPVISGVKPKSVVWGTSEAAITVIGTGFHEESVIIFEGSTYKPVVNQAGTRLDITIETANLIGAEGETRTLTLFPEPDFESGASTSSATSAWGGFPAKAQIIAPPFIRASSLLRTGVQIALLR